MLVAEPGVVQAAQGLPLEKPEWLEVSLDQFAHLENILTHNTDNVTVLGVKYENLKIYICNHNVKKPLDGS